MTNVSPLVNLYLGLILRNLLHAELSLSVLASRLAILEGKKLVTKLSINKSRLSEAWFKK